MKTSDLIRRLQAVDPSGELECVVDGVDIYFVEREPGYYDGPFEVLEHDPEKRGKAWSIVCGRISTRGYKINLHTLSIESALTDDPTLPVRIDVHDSAHGRVAANVTEWRRAAEELNRQEDENA